MKSRAYVLASFLAALAVLSAACSLERTSSVVDATWASGESPGTAPSSRGLVESKSMRPQLAPATRSQPHRIPTVNQYATRCGAACDSVTGARSSRTARDDHLGHQVRLDRLHDEADLAQRSCEIVLEVVRIEWLVELARRT